MMIHGSLFSGIGGFDLAANWAGWENAFHCEWNEFGQKVLKYYWPKAESFTDITKTDFTPYANKIDVLTGGFPCQPYSAAGKRLGKEDDRHLWPEMLRAIREIKPRWVVGENVRGLISWNGGLVFDEVQTDLESEGYEVQPFLLPACAVNAPHRRDRIWFVAYCSDSDATKQKQKSGGEYRDKRERREKMRGEFNDTGLPKSTSNGSDARIKDMQRKREDGVYGFEIIADSKSQQGKRMQSKQREISQQEQREFRGGNCSGSSQWSSIESWTNFPTQTPICRRNDGVSERLDGITFPKWRNESIKAYGNAIVPQVALQIFKAINEYENQNNEI